MFTPGRVDAILVADPMRMAYLAMCADALVIA